MLGEDAHGDSLGVAEQHPKLDKGQQSNPGDSEKPNPFNASSDAEAQTSHDEPKPPARLEGLRRALLMLVGERREGEGGEGGGEDERGIEQDETGLGQESILCDMLEERRALVYLYSSTLEKNAMKLTEDDQRGTESSGGSAATRSLQSQEDGRNEENTADGREGSHGDIGDTWLQVILADLLKVEAAIESSQPPEESDHKLRQWRVNIHKELSLDVFRSKTTKAVEYNNQYQLLQVIASGESLESVKDGERGGEKEGRRSTYWTSSKTTLVGW